MSIQMGRKALDFGVAQSQEPCGVVFFGGEPLLQKDTIQDLVAYAAYLESKQGKQLYFKVTTNGVALDDEFLEYSIRHNIFIAMSLDGVREAHDRHRRLSDGSPSFDFLRPRLETLLEARPYSSIIMVVNPDTARFVCDSVRYLMELSCRYLILSLNYNAPWDEADLSVLNRQMEKLGELYIEWTREGRKFYLSPFEVKISSHVNKHCYQKERCELAARQVSVDPQGFLYPCVQFTKAGPSSDWCIGSLDTGIVETRRQALRDQSEAEKEQCSQCAISKRCNNTCGCLNWQTTGTINEVSPVLCRYEQMLLPIADKVARRLYSNRDPLFLHKHYNAAYPILSLLEDTLGKGS